MKHKILIAVGAFFLLLSTASLFMGFHVQGYAERDEARLQSIVPTPANSKEREWLKEDIEGYKTEAMVEFGLSPIFGVFGLGLVGFGIRRVSRLDPS